MGRTFEDREAVREQVPLLVGLMGPSGGGKTFSALRLATGFQRVSGGDIFVIDTEARRALHYADRFKFRHIAFPAPFGPKKPKTSPRLTLRVRPATAVFRPNSFRNCSVSIAKSDI